METCNGCGKPIGHTDTIVAEYKEHGIKIFGREECKETFEETYSATPCQTCKQCGRLVEEDVADEIRFSHNKSVLLSGFVHPSCKEDFFNTDDVYTEKETKQ